MPLRPSVCVAYAAEECRPATPTAPTYPGHGGAGAQPEHHAFPRRRADAVLARSTTAWTPLPRAAWSCKNMLLATEAGLGYGETPIFPIQIFRVKEGVNYNPGGSELRPVQAGHALLGQAPVPELLLPGCARSTLQYYKGTSGNRDRLHGLPHPRHGQRVRSRPRGDATAAATCRFTSINLPRLAIKRQGRHRPVLRRCSTRKLQLVIDQLDRALRDSGPQAACTTAPFLMGQGVWIDSEKLELGPTRCARCSSTARCPSASSAWPRRLVALTGQHHGESAEAQRLGLEIIGHMRSCCDRDVARSAA